MKKLACGFVVLLTLVGITGLLTPAIGQEVTAAIVGTVTDPSGAPIKGASVKATDADRGTVWTAETNDSGAYNLLRLPISTYGV
ncbi:MAG: carboxypeptidase-like regulatory domain-containing protein, partial [Candidatus Sulfotelmatobacter sp.]